MVRMGPRSQTDHPTRTCRAAAALSVKPKTVRERGVEKTSRGYSRSELTDPWTRYDTSDTTTQKDEKAAPTSEDARVGAVSDDDSETDTAFDKGKWTDRVAVSDVSEQVQEPYVLITECERCQGPLVWPDSQQRGTCSQCRMKSA